MIEFQALGAMQSNKSHARLALKLIRVAYQCRGIEKIGEGLSRFHAFGERTSKLFEVFQARDILGSVAVLEHRHVARFLENRVQKCRRLLGSKGILQLANEFLECSQRSYGPAR